MSTRAALGAGRGRIVRQLLTESLVLSAVGSALGALIAWWGTKVIVALAPDRIPGIHGAHVDGRVLAATLGVSAVTGVLFGLAPALTLAGDRSGTVLRAGQTVRGRGRLQRTMIAVELALSVVLLVGAGLLSRSLEKLSSVDPGFRSENMLAISVSGRGNYWEDTTRLRLYNDRVLPRLRAIPGVVNATLASTVPFSGSTSSSAYLLPGEGDAERVAHKHEADQRTIATNYFAMMGIPVVAGRAFSTDDRAGTDAVAIISEAAARRDFPTETAIGKRILYQGEWRTIVGIVRDVKVTRLSADDQPSIYTPLAQRSGELPDIILETHGDVAGVATAARTAIRDVDPTIIPGTVEPMRDLLRRSFNEERFRTALIVLFGAIAAVLAAVGMFGVTARAVSRRTREVGIRVALGAQSRAVVMMIVNQTLAGVAAGVMLGSLIALAVSRALAPYLFGVTTYDPVTYASIFALLAGVSILASWLPARRAGRVEPAIVLRGE